MIIARNKSVEIIEVSPGKYAINCPRDRFTFYLFDEVEKVLFVKTLESALDKAKKYKVKDFFVTFGKFALKLNKKETKFLIENIPLTDLEKSIKLQPSNEKIH